MTPDIRKERETALYEAALRLIAKGVNPAAMKVQQIADEAGIGKGTVYEYFASKGLEDAVMAYPAGLSGNRMGTYQVIASSIGARENLRSMDEVAPWGGCRTWRPAAKGVTPPVYCDLALLSAAAGGT